jgi:hypothetical protein
VQQAVLCLGLLASAPTLVLAQDSSAAEPPVSNSALSAPLFYQLLLGELTVASGEPGAGYSLILDAARKQNDPDLFRRAVEIALQARSGCADSSACLVAGHPGLTRSQPLRTRDSAGAQPRG